MRRMLFGRSLAIAVATIIGLAVAPADADWCASGAGDFSGTAGYTILNIQNIGTKSVTVQVDFYDESGTVVASPNQSVAPLATWTVSTSSGFTNPVATGDFSGAVRISSTGSFKKLAPFGALAFPIDGSGIIGNSLAVSGMPLNWVKCKP
jgi:hypothetical protein